MIDAWKALRLEQFESITASSSTALLRVTAKPSRRWGEQRRPALRVGYDQSIRRYAPIPAPSDPRGVLRAAYSVPLALLGPETTFWLEHDDGSLTELPPPTWGLTLASAVPSGSGLAETPAHSERASAESGRARQLAAELAEARDRAEQAEAANQKLTATLDELEVWQAELERRLAATTTELGAAKIAREADQQELARLRAALPDPISATAERTAREQAELELRDAVGRPSGGPTS